MKTYKLSELKAGNRFLSSDGETEYIIVDDKPDKDLTKTVNLSNGKITYFLDKERFAITVNYRARLLGLTEV